MTFSKKAKQFQATRMELQLKSGGEKPKFLWNGFTHIELEGNDTFDCIRQRATRTIDYLMQMKETEKRNPC